MIGVGPFITIPLIISAMGGPQAMLGWLLGAGLALCDGLVWAELGAAMPEEGGTYAYLARMFPGQWGRWLSFLFVFQLCLSAPLSIASGCIGLAQYAGFLWPGLRSHGAVHVAKLGPVHAGVSFGVETWLAMAAVVVAVALQMRRVGKLRVLSLSLLVVVLFTIASAIVTGVLRGHVNAVFAFGPDAWRMDGAFWAGLGSAMLIATYDYWGYYNVTFLGGEVKDAARVIPRAVLGSIAIVGVLYLLLNASVLAVLGAPSMMAAGNIEARRALLSEFMRAAWGPVLGAAQAVMVGKVAAVLVMVTAFASVFSLLLGYSRIPYAAARDGNFLHGFARLDKTGGFPVVSLVALGAVACLCCMLSLSEVIAALVVLRILLQFAMQHVGMMLWRKREPDAVRPFRVWLYPLPPVLALLGFAYIVVSRVGSVQQVVLAAGGGGGGTGGGVLGSRF